MKGLTEGRIVHYVMPLHHAEEVNRRRTDSIDIAYRLKAVPPQWPVGAQAHIGNEVREGDICPMMVVRDWHEPAGTVNGQVFLDGTDVLWATSVSYSAEPKPDTWHWPEHTP